MTDFEVHPVGTGAKLDELSGRIDQALENCKKQLPRHCVIAVNVENGRAWALALC